MALLILCASSVGAQTFSERGFIEGRGFGFPQTAPNDDERGIWDGLFRQEVFLNAKWFRFAAGLDMRANSHRQVEDDWRLDYEDRGILRPRASVRRLTATLTGGGFTLDVGKQFVRWGRTDVLSPTDRFAPRDFLNVIDSEFLPVIGARAAIELGPETLEAVWVPQLTPSRIPLLDQRWAALPSQASTAPVLDMGSRFPERAQVGARWRHTGGRFEAAVSYFDGFNHFPTIDLQPRANAIEISRTYPRLRTYGADMAIPTGWFTLKLEAAYFTSPPKAFEDYALYVVEMERQTGEWLLTAGYAGEVVKSASKPLAFDFERELARSFVGRVSYTVDPRRTVAIEGAVRQTGTGEYVKGEYSQAIGQHWRMTLTGVGLAGKSTDFMGQFERNSHVSLALRLSF